MTVFRPLAEKSVRWQPVDGTGLEHLTARSEGASIVISSVVIGGRGGKPYGVHYRIECDQSWVVRRFDLETTDGRGLRLISDGSGRWTDARGERMPQFDGCIDIDLAGTPFTNTLPIRRIDLDVDQGAVEFSMLYVPFDTFAPTADGQRYRCLEVARRYRYEAVDRTFAADLTVDEDGFVIDYPTLFARVS